MPLLTYPANALVPERPAGYQFTHAGVTWTFNQMFVTKGQVTVEIEENNLASPATVQVSPVSTNYLHGSAQVQNHSALSLCLADYQVCFEYEWDQQPVVLIASNLSSTSLNSWSDALGRQSGFGRILKAIDLDQLAAETKTTALPPLDKWEDQFTFLPPVTSFAPNPLNEAEATKDAALPQFHTAAAIVTPDGLHSLSLLIGIEGKHAVASMNLFAWPTYPKGEAQRLKSWLVTDQLENPYHFSYLQLWLSFQHAKTLPIIHSTPAVNSHSMIIGTTLSGPYNTINPRVPFQFTENSLIPLQSIWGTVPLKTTAAPPRTNS